MTVRVKRKINKYIKKNKKQKQGCSSLCLLIILSEMWDHLYFKKPVPRRVQLFSRMFREAFLKLNTLKSRKGRGEKKAHYRWLGQPIC